MSNKPKKTRAKGARTVVKPNATARPSANGRPAELLPQHRDDLERSGLSLETIEAAGFWSETNPEKVAAVLNRRTLPEGVSGPFLMIPFYGLDGEFMKYVRVKPDHPRTVDDKVVKYEAPAGRPNRAYFGPGLEELLNASEIRLITEGEKKGLSGIEKRIATVAVTGAWAWQRKRPRDEDGRGTGPRELIDDLAGLSWKGKQVYVAFDSDAATNPDVRLAERELALVLKAHGAEVRIIRLPPGPDGAKQGLDDYLIAHGADALRQLMAEAPSVPSAVTVADFPVPTWPDPMADEAFCGLAGEVVRVLGPSSESDLAALLLQLLVGFGNLLGRTAHGAVEADKHFGNESVVLVGRTSKGRKGTSWGHIRRLLAAADEAWAHSRISSGLSSGEGLIWQVRDRIVSRQPIKEQGRVVDYQEVETDPGIADKRLLVIESEYASLLKQVERQGNVLSAVLRLAWETGDLSTLTKNNPARASGAHISLIGHCTAEELHRYLSTTEMANGFANRTLWICVRRSKELPEGGQVDGAALAELGRRLGEALAFGRGLGEVRRDKGARQLWRAVYSALSADRPGLAGAMLGRAEAHVLRLSLLYAVLDRSHVVRLPHLMAALAVWTYCEASVRFVFGDSLGDPVADDLLRLMRGCRDGLTRTDIRDYFQRNASADRIGRALGLLAEHRLVRCEQQQTGGRPVERWFATSIRQG
jgi:hypothetical protein